MNKEQQIFRCSCSCGGLGAHNWLLLQLLWFFSSANTAFRVRLLAIESDKHISSKSKPSYLIASLPLKDLLKES